MVLSIFIGYQRYGGMGLDLGYTSADVRVAARQWAGDYGCTVKFEKTDRYTEYGRDRCIQHI